MHPLNHFCEMCGLQWEGGRKWNEGLRTQDTDCRMKDVGISLFLQIHSSSQDPFSFPAHLENRYRKQRRERREEVRLPELTPHQGSIPIPLFNSYSLNSVSRSSPPSIKIRVASHVSCVFHISCSCKSNGCTKF